MRMLERLRVLFTGRLPHPGKQVGRQLVFAGGQPVYPQDNYRDLVSGGYSKNELVYACINEIASSAPEAPLRVYDTENDDVRDDHPLRQLIARPNPFLSEFELWELTIIHLYLAGNAFWEKVRSSAGRVVELWPLRPDRVRIVPHARDWIAGYQYRIDGRTFELGRDDVIHFRFPDPLNDFLGMPPLRAALRAVATDNEMTDFAKVMLQNGALPGVVITTQEAIDEATVERLSARWKQKFGGRRRGEPAFLQQGMEVHTVGLDMQQLAFPDLRMISETRICAALGVPPILVGAQAGLARSTFANYGEARRSFWEETIAPLLRRFADKINTQLLPEWPGSERLEARFDTGDVSALQELHRQTWERADAAVRSGWITVNEARAQVGFHPVAGGDVFLRPLTTVATAAEVAAPPSLDREAETRELRIPLRVMEALCPGCAKEMRRRGLTALKVGALKQMPPQLLEGLCRTIGGDPGFFTRCMEFEFGDFEAELRGNKEGFCAWLHFQCLGKWPAEKAVEARSFGAGRMALAERHETRWREVAAAEFTAQIRQTRRALEAQMKALDPEVLEALRRQVTALATTWQDRLARAAGPLVQQLMTDAAQLAAGEVGLAPDAAAPLVAREAMEQASRLAGAAAESSQRSLLELLDAARDQGLSQAELRARLEALGETWSAGRAETLARTETARAANRGARLIYRQAGLQRVRWQVQDGACPYCAAMEGRVIPIDGQFLGPGETLQPTGAERPLVAGSEAVDGPPLHPNCRCLLVPDVP